MVARRFAELGFAALATAGTARFLDGYGVSVSGVVAKLHEAPDRPGMETPERALPVDLWHESAVDLIAEGKIHLVVNTPEGRGPQADGSHIRRAASAQGIPCLTTLAAALAAAGGIADWGRYGLSVKSLQEYQEGGQ